MENFDKVLGQVDELCDQAKEITKKYGKKESKIVEDYLTQEATRIVDGEFNEEEGTWNSHPIRLIAVLECDNPRDGEIWDETCGREKLIEFIKEKIRKII